MSIFCALLSITLAASTVESGTSTTRRGLSAKGEESLEELLKLQNDPVLFTKRLESLGSKADFETAMVLTHVMFELPWVKNLEPQGRGDVRMPKLAVERLLDHLIAVPKHDQLSGDYFGAILDGDKVKQSEDALLDWMLSNRGQFIWEDGRCFLKNAKE